MIRHFLCASAREILRAFVRADAQGAQGPQAQYPLRASASPRGREDAVLNGCTGLSPGNGWLGERWP